MFIFGSFYRFWWLEAIHRKAGCWQTTDNRWGRQWRLMRILSGSEAASSGAQPAFFSEHWTIQVRWKIRELLNNVLSSTRFVLVFLCIVFFLFPFNCLVFSFSPPSVNSENKSFTSVQDQQSRATAGPVVDRPFPRFSEHTLCQSHGSSSAVGTAKGCGAWA